MKKLTISLYILLSLPIVSCLIMLVLDYGILLSTVSTLPLYIFLIPYSVKKLKELKELDNVGVKVKAKAQKVIGYFKGVYHVSVDFKLNEKDETTLLYLNHDPTDKSYLILIHPENFKKYIILETIKEKV